MASTVQIANRALTKLGAATITDMLDNTKSARVMNGMFDIVRDAELAAQPWSFASKRVELPASSTAPPYGWARAFPLPSDYLRLIEVGEDYVYYDTDTGALFQVEGGSILTDQASPLQVRYTSRVTNSGLFPALFIEALACRLAAEACESITQSASKREQAWAEHKQAVREARRANAFEQPPRQLPATSWVRAMFGW